jgi:flavin reductase
MSIASGYHYRMKQTLFKDAMAQVPTNVGVVGSWEEGTIRACTISSLVSIDIVDPTLTFVLKTDSATLANIKSTKDFSINVLSAYQENLSQIYSNLSTQNDSSDHAQYWEVHKSGIPIIKDAHLSFVCFLTSTQDLKNATIVFAKVSEIIKSNSENPLIYFERKYFRIK